MRSIAGIIVGYAVLFAFIFVAFIGAYSLLGVEVIFQRESYLVTPIWMMTSAVLTVIGAMLAGSVCAMISKSKGTCELLATVVLVTLLVFCVPKIRDPRPKPRLGNVPATEAMRLTQMPIWMHVLNPILGGLGVIMGSKKRLPKPLPGLST